MLSPEQSAALRKPFPPEAIGKLPRVWCRSCTAYKACDNHRVQRCDQCRQKITTAHLHLDYVGHAEITDRLLQVDPAWNWEPVANDTDGLPKFDAHGGLWIRLTVGGVTRLGYGDAQGKTGPNAIKEAIGDALRNAAMRYGVGIDLWGATYKGDADDKADLEQTDSDQQALYVAGIRAQIDEAKTKTDFGAARTRIDMALDRKKITEDQAAELAAYGKTRYEASRVAEQTTISTD
jgi:hypothetical protein